MTEVEVGKRWCRTLITSIYPTLGVVAVGAKWPQEKC